jgi:hypothetical protein
MPDAAASIDAAPDSSGTDKSAGCASTFGAALTNAFGRVDGTVLAILAPGNQTCAMPNSTHVVLEVTMNGAAYRMVVNVLSTSNVPDVWLGATDAPLAGPPWSEGWHPGVQLDYVTTLGVTKAMFTESMQAAAVARVTDAITIGAHISVYATSSGGTQAASTHLIHRNLTNQDGAIVLDPETAPHYLLTAFPEQSF